MHSLDYPAGLPSYQRFVEWIPQTLLPLCVYLNQCFGACTGISCLVALFMSGNPTSSHRFIDSTCLKVCHNRRISRHKVFKNLAARGKTSVDWFFGFKLHFVVNENGELLNITLTSGNADDRKPVPDLVSLYLEKSLPTRGMCLKI
jgi:Transposase DDE domain